MGAHSLLLDREVPVERQDVLDTRFFTQQVPAVELQNGRKSRHRRPLMINRRERALGFKIFLAGLPLAIGGGIGAAHLQEIIAQINTAGPYILAPVAPSSPPSSAVVTTPDATSPRSNAPTRQGPRANSSTPVQQTPQTPSTVYVQVPVQQVIVMPPSTINVTPTSAATPPPVGKTTVATPSFDAPTSTPATTSSRTTSPAAAPAAAATTTPPAPRHAAADAAPSRPPSMTPIYDQLAEEFANAAKGP